MSYVFAVWLGEKTILMSHKNLIRTQAFLVFLQRPDDEAVTRLFFCFVFLLTHPIEGLIGLCDGKASVVHTYLHNSQELVQDEGHIRFHKICCFFKEYSCDFSGTRLICPPYGCLWSSLTSRWILPVTTNPRPFIKNFTFYNNLWILVDHKLLHHWYSGSFFCASKTFSLA